MKGHSSPKPQQRDKKMKVKRPAKWSRISDLTEDQQKRLDDLCSKTSGMSIYGNRARTAIMLPVDIAEKVALMTSYNGLSVSSTCGSMIETAIILMELATEDQMLVMWDRLRNRRS